LVELHQRLNVEGVDAIVLSACVQMPSLAAIATVEAKVGVPVVSAATCTAWQMMKKLDLEPRVPQAGALLAGGFA
jgi:maleate isomerase